MYCRRGVAYRGMGSLQEALRSFEGADASAEAEGADSARKALARCVLLYCRNGSKPHCAVLASNARGWAVSTLGT